MTNQSGEPKSAPVRDLDDWLDAARGRFVASGLVEQIDRRPTRWDEAGPWVGHLQRLVWAGGSALASADVQLWRDGLQECKAAWAASVETLQEALVSTGAVDPKFGAYTLCGFIGDDEVRWAVDQDGDPVFVAEFDRLRSHEPWRGVLNGGIAEVVDTILEGAAGSALFAFAVMAAHRLLPFGESRVHLSMTEREAQAFAEMYVAGQRGDPHQELILVSAGSEMAAMQQGRRDWVTVTKWTFTFVAPREEYSVALGLEKDAPVPTLFALSRKESPTQRYEELMRFGKHTRTVDAADHQYL